MSTIVADFDDLHLSHHNEEERSYKSSCEFSDGDQSHLYGCNNISENSFTKTQLLSIHLPQIITRNQISRAAYREIVMFVNTALRDMNNILLNRRDTCNSISW
ncbi:hypothetical protein BDF21DRAFT_405987 [Thamnidium elegans]|nr:hypothetical protein BDF21DRAFT_405987 [Thamnidium elegans]